MQPSTPETNSSWRIYLGRVLKRTCPSCGNGRLFRSHFHLAKACDCCGLIYRREDGAFTGQMYLSAAVTEIFAAVLVLLAFFATDWSVSTSIAVVLPLVVLFSYWFLPHAMALWVAIEFMTDVGNRERWVQKDRASREP